MKPFRHFFDQNPALFYALSALTGTFAALENAPSILLCNGLLLLPYLKTWRALLGPLVSYAAYLLAALQFVFTEIPKDGIEADAWISIDQVSYQSRGHAPSFIYRGKIKKWLGKEILRGVPYYMIIPQGKKERPKADCDYIIHCKISPSHGARVVMKPSFEHTWERIENHSFAERRYQAKQTVTHFIAEHFASPPVAVFLSGLIVGEFDDIQLKQDFGRFGLLHLLAISGFHFSIMASLCGKVLRPLLNPRWLSFILMLIVSAYFCFLGMGPSVLRAFMTILLFYGALLQNRTSLALNSLGFALLFSIILDPLLVENLGFQFSFLSTLAILMGLKPSLTLLEKIFPKRDLDTLLKWPKEDQVGYLILGFLKDNFALTLATTVVALPISLYYFQAFPLLSLLYNLFFPFLVSITMSLLLFSLILSPLPWISSALDYFNDYFTSFILNMTYEIPSGWDIWIRSKPFSPIWLASLLIFMFISNIYIQKSENKLILFENKIN